MTVSGIGWVKATKLVDAGCTTLDQLRQHPFYENLTPSIRVALDFMEYMDQSVTHEEAETVAAFIRENVSPKFEVLLVGSYRRKATSCSDIDVLLFHPAFVHVPTPAEAPSGTARNTVRRRQPSLSFRATYSKASSRKASPLSSDVVQPLIEKGLIAGTFTSGASKWQGIVRIPQRVFEHQWEEKTNRLEHIADKTGSFRRMDLNLAPMKSRGAALLALTGDVDFNRNLRARATKLGMHLNEFGLWRWQSHDKDVDGEEEKGFWELVRAESEEDIMSALGMRYVVPEGRNDKKGVARGKP
ncbi:hypothetical protein AcV5_007929 [Taiwanofungus camphoratus]|nr:hypothetical protein AcV7_006070 [Antrodia cinnamomea]KAI0927376.1 hypothetical protein AcV5_007929 [Antrodia cinnamomea]